MQFKIAFVFFVVGCGVLDYYTEFHCRLIGLLFLSYVNENVRLCIPWQDSNTEFYLYPDTCHINNNMSKALCSLLFHFESHKHSVR